MCENQVSHIWSGAFFVNFGLIQHNVFLFLLQILNGLGRLSKIKDLCDFEIS